MLKRFFIYTLILSIACVPCYSQDFVSRPTRSHGILEINGGGVVQVGSGTLSQTYAWTNRTRINSAGLLEAVAANTPVIDYIGASLEPHLRVEPAGMNLLFNSRFATNGNGFTATATMANSGAVGADGVAGSGLLVTDDSALANQEMYRGIDKSASDSTTYFMATVWVRKETSATCYPLLGVTFSGGTTKYAAIIINHVAGSVVAWTDNTAANIGSQIKAYGNGWQVDVWATDNGSNTSAYWDFMPAANADASNAADVTAVGSVTIDYGKLSTGKVPSSLFEGSAAIGDEIVTDGGFAAVTEGAEMASDTLTAGNCYKITAHTDADFTTVGAPDSNVGTYFNATGTGAGLLDAGDKVKPITFTNFVAGVGWAPQATAGSLTGKAQKIAGTASTLYQNNIGTAAKTYRVSSVITRSSGSCLHYVRNSASPAISATGTHVSYIALPAFPGTTYSGIHADVAFAGTVDDLSIKEHGSVRLSEANTVTLSMPTAVSTALAATGTLVTKMMFGYARAAGVAGNIIAATTAEASLLYTTTAAGNLSSYDGTNIAASTAAYTALTSTKLAVKWPSTANKFKIGADVAGGGIAYGAEAAFDGAYTVGANLILGYTLYGPLFFKEIKLYNSLLSDAQINAM